MQRVLLAMIVGLLFTPALAQPVPAPGTAFHDCQQCPEMIVVPAGSFTMGETGHSRETPLHQVTFAKSFAIGIYTVTFEQWDACAADAGCSSARPGDYGWGGARRPVVDVTWNAAKSYVLWLSRKTGKPYRLPSEAEWEYAARGGTTTLFWWGDDVRSNMANCDGCGSSFDNRQTAPVGSFKPNPFGLYDTAGNVTQWVEDPWHSNYEGAPTDGSVWSQGGDPRRMVMRSGSWFNNPRLSHSGYRNGDAPAVHNSKIGFRVALSLQ